MSEQFFTPQQSWDLPSDIEPPRGFSTTRSYFGLESSSESGESTILESKPYTPIYPTTMNKQPLLTRPSTSSKSHQKSIDDSTPRGEDTRAIDDNQGEEMYEEAQEEELEEEYQDENLKGERYEADLAIIFQNLNRTLKKINKSQTTESRETQLVQLPIFKGGEQDPLQWIQEFDAACLANHITEERRIEIVPAYLKGLAHAWWRPIADRVQYWNDDTHDQRSFSHLFLGKWLTTHQKGRWMNQLRNRTQRPGETVDEYWNDLYNLYLRVDPEEHYPAEDRLHQFLYGLRNEIREPVEIAGPVTIAEALQRARAVESTFSRNAPLSVYSLQRNQSSGNNDLQDIKSVLTQLSQGFQQLATKSTSNNRGNIGNNNNNNQRETRTCNNCGKVGHLARYCRSQPRNNNNNYNNRRPFNSNNNNNRGPRTCFNCHQPGHISTNCPQRQSNNSTNRSGSSSNNNRNNNTQNHWLNLPMGDFLETAKKVKKHLN